MTLISYMITCLTEQLRVVTPFMDSIPTTCPNNTGHTIDPNQTIEYKSLAAKQVTVIEKENGWFQSTCISHTIPSTTTPPEITSFDMSWPSDIYLMSTKLYFETSSAGDSFNVICAPDTPLGVTTGTVSIGSTTIPVSTTVINNITRGLHVTLFDGNNRNELDRVTAIDVSNSTITVETATTNEFMTGTAVLLNVHCVRNFDICSTMIAPGNGIEIGNRQLNGKIVNANTIMRFSYKNNNGSAKTVASHTEYMILG